jgi:hypothetical protein
MQSVSRCATELKELSSRLSLPSELQEKLDELILTVEK